MDRDQELALRLTSALMEYWLRRGNFGEGRDGSAKLLAHTHAWEHSAKRAQAWSITGWLAFFQHDFGTARTVLETSLATARQSGDRKRIAFVLQWLGWTITLMGDRKYPLAQQIL